MRIIAKKITKETSDFSISNLIFHSIRGNEQKTVCRMWKHILRGFQGLYSNWKGYQVINLPLLIHLVYVERLSPWSQERLNWVCCYCYCPFEGNTSQLTNVAINREIGVLASKLTASLSLQLHKRVNKFKGKLFIQGLHWKYIGELGFLHRDQGTVA